MRGRKPKPTALKELSGNPGKRALNKKEPKPKPLLAIPECPSHLKGAAREEWKRLAKELFYMNMISKVDRAALAACCTAWGDYVKASKELEKEGEVIFSLKGGVYQNPWMAIKKRSMDQVIKFYGEFGMTPSSRSRVKVDLLSDEEELEKMLFGKDVRVGK